MSFEVAQINIARLVATIDDPRIAEFVSELASINALAEASPATSATGQRRPRSGSRSVFRRPNR